MRLKAIADIVKTAGKGFFENHAMMRAAALGFYSVLALAPLLVIFVSVTGFLGEDAQTGLIQQVETLVGPEASQFVRSLISYTSENRTAGGKNAVGKLMKLRADMLFLLLAQVERRLIVLTEPDMYEQCLKEVQGGRVPPSIEFLHAEIPDELKIRLRKARQVASREVFPHQGD